MSYEKMNSESCIVSTPEHQKLGPCTRLGNNAGPSSPLVYYGLLQINKIQSQIE